MAFIGTIRIVHNFAVQMGYIQACLDFKLLIYMALCRTRRSIIISDKLYLAHKNINYIVWLQRDKDWLNFNYSIYH